MTTPASDSSTAETNTPSVSGELFENWRHAVTWVRDAGAAAIYRFSGAEQPEVAAHWLCGRHVVAAGGVLLVAGAVAGVALAAPGLERTLAAWAGAQAILWVVARWLLMRYVSAGRRAERSALLGAASLGLFAYGIAITPELRAVAWVASAVLTWTGLVLLGSDRRTAAGTVSLAWGAQALVVVGGWIARGTVLAFLVTAR